MPLMVIPHIGMTASIAGTDSIAGTGGTVGMIHLARTIAGIGTHTVLGTALSPVTQDMAMVSIH